MLFLKCELCGVAGSLRCEKDGQIEELSVVCRILVLYSERNFNLRNTRGHVYRIFPYTNLPLPDDGENHEAFLTTNNKD